MAPKERLRAQLEQSMNPLLHQFPSVQRVALINDILAALETRCRSDENAWRSIDEDYQVMAVSLARDTVTTPPNGDNSVADDFRLISKIQLPLHAKFGFNLATALVGSCGPDKTSHRKFPCHCDIQIAERQLTGGRHTGRLQRWIWRCCQYHPSLTENGVRLVASQQSRV